MSYITTQFNKVTKRNKPALTEKLADKAQLLRIEADSHVSVADHMVRAAAEEKAAARTKVSHAVAVEKATAILTDAGVEL